MALSALLLAVALSQAPSGVDAPDADGLTALMRAAARADAAALQALVAKGAALNHQAEGTRLTALMCAAYFGHTEIVKTLLARGAKPDREGRQRRQCRRLGQRRQSRRHRRRAGQGRVAAQPVPERRRDALLR